MARSDRLRTWTFVAAAFLALTRSEVAAQAGSLGIGTGVVGDFPVGRFLRRSGRPQESLRVALPAGDRGRGAFLQPHRVGRARRNRAEPIPRPGGPPCDREPGHRHSAAGPPAGVGSPPTSQPVPPTPILGDSLTACYTGDGEHLRFTLERKVAAVAETYFRRGARRAVRAVRRSAPDVLR